MSKSWFRPCAARVSEKISKFLSSNFAVIMPFSAEGWMYDAGFPSVQGAFLLFDSILFEYFVAVRYPVNINKVLSQRNKQVSASSSAPHRKRPSSSAFMHVAICCSSCSSSSDIIPELIILFIVFTASPLVIHIVNLLSSGFALP